MLEDEREIAVARVERLEQKMLDLDRKSTRLNSSHSQISYAVFCLKKNNDSCTLRPAHGSEAPSTYGDGWATARRSPWHNRVPQGTLAKLEPIEWKRSPAVLRDLSGS